MLVFVWLMKETVFFFSFDSQFQIFYPFLSQRLQPRAGTLFLG